MNRSFSQKRIEVRRILAERIVISVKELSQLVGVTDIIRMLGRKSTDEETYVPPTVVIETYRRCHIIALRDYQERFTQGEINQALQRTYEFLEIEHKIRTDKLTITAKERSARKSGQAKPQQAQRVTPPTLLTLLEEYRHAVTVSRAG